VTRIPRATDNVVAIVATMQARPKKPWYGLELAKRADIGSATIYAALTRLERAGLVEATWEVVDPVEAGRPRRRLYTLTGEGARVAATMVAEHKPRAHASTDWNGWRPDVGELPT
jgi:PadR family transcriptional regulator PadR